MGRILDGWSENRYAPGAALAMPCANPLTCRYLGPGLAVTLTFRNFRIVSRHSRPGNSCFGLLSSGRCACRSATWLPSPSASSGRWWNGAARSSRKASACGASAGRTSTGRLRGRLARALPTGDEAHAHWRARLRLAGRAASPAPGPGAGSPRPRRLSRACQRQSRRPQPATTTSPCRRRSNHQGVGCGTQRFSVRHRPASVFAPRCSNARVGSDHRPEGGHRPPRAHRHARRTRPPRASSRLLAQRSVELRARANVTAIALRPGWTRVSPTPISVHPADLSLACLLDASHRRQRTDRRPPSLTLDSSLDFRDIAPEDAFARSDLLSAFLFPVLLSYFLLYALCASAAGLPSVSPVRRSPRRTPSCRSTSACPRRRRTSAGCRTSPRSSWPPGW